MTDNSTPSKTMRRVPVGTRYPEDRVALLDVAKVRRGVTHRSEVIEIALDRFLVDEGLLDAA